MQEAGSVVCCDALNGEEGLFRGPLEQRAQGTLNVPG